MSSLTAPSDRPSSGLSGRVSGPSISSISSFCGVSSVLLAMSLHSRRWARAELRSSRVADSLKRRRRLRQNFICRRIFRFPTQTRRKSLSFRGRDVFSVQSPASKRRSGHQLNVLSRKARPCAGPRRSFLIFSTSELEERIHLPQVTAAQELQIKAQTRLAALMEEKLVTRISVLSTLLGGGKTTERLLVRISVETHKTSPDFDQTAADKAKNRIKQALGEIGCDVFIETDR